VFSYNASVTLSRWVLRIVHNIYEVILQVINKFDYCNNSGILNDTAVGSLNRWLSQSRRDHFNEALTVIEWCFKSFTLYSSSLQCLVLSIYQSSPMMMQYVHAVDGDFSLMAELWEQTHFKRSSCDDVVQWRSHGGERVLGVTPLVANVTSYLLTFIRILQNLYFIYPI